MRGRVRAPRRLSRLAGRAAAQMLAHFVRILVQCAPPPGSGAGAVRPASGQFTVVAVQLLQSLSILVQNTRRETSIYFLFSNNYINDLMELKQFDYGVDEEVLAWYISFLKAISLRLNERTIQFFISDATPSDRGKRAPGVPAAFPLYSQVTRYVQHQDSMVRAAARAATLNVFTVDDPAVRRASASETRATIDRVRFAGAGVRTARARACILFVARGIAARAEPSTVQFACCSYA